MINIKKYVSLYDLVINNNVITTKLLNENGLNSRDINELIDLGYIRRVKRGYYEYIKVDSLFNYGKTLINLRKYDFAHKCFLRCYDIEPNNFNVCFQLFYDCVYRNEYDRIFDYFDVIFNNSNGYDFNNLSLYLYLLSYIIDIPSKYRAFLDNLEFCDLKISSKYKDVKNIMMKNRIRKMIFEDKINLAYHNSLKLLELSGEKDVTNNFINRLLFKVNINNFERNSMILTYLKQGNYSKVKELLFAGKLSASDHIILRLIDVIEQLENGVIPEVKVHEASNLDNAIDGNNFELAKELNEDFNILNNIDPENSIIHILLDVICKKINNIKNKGISDNSIVTNITNLLLSNNIDEVFNLINTYLDSIGRNEYYYVVVNLIKLSVINKDFTYKSVIEVLNNLADKNYVVCEKDYIDGFYDAVKTSSESVNIYYDILVRLSSMEDSKIDMDEVNVVYNQFMNRTTKKSNSKLNGVSESKKMCFEDIALLIIESGLNVITASRELGFNDEEIDTIILNCAKTFYLQGRKIEGDKFIKCFERSEHKTEENLNLYQSILRQKKLYLNRKDSSLILPKTLKP